MASWTATCAGKHADKAKNHVGHKEKGGGREICKVRYETKKLTSMTNGSLFIYLFIFFQKKSDMFN